MKKRENDKAARWIEEVYRPWYAAQARSGNNGPPPPPPEDGG